MEPTLNPAVQIYVAPDVLDLEEAASNMTQESIENAVNTVRSAAAKIPKGCQGTCEICDEYYERVVEVDYKGSSLTACARCRDQYKIGY